MNKVQFNVTGVANSQDKTKVKNALEKLDGVHVSSIDLANGTIEVDYNDPASEQEIRSCIENTGYDVSATY